MGELEKRESQIHAVQDRGDALIAQHHPAFSCIEAYMTSSKYQRGAIRKALSGDVEKVLEQCDRSDPQLRRLERETFEVNQLFDEFERQAAQDDLTPEAFQPKEPEWISLVNRGVPISSIEEFTPLWDAMKHSTVYELLSTEDFDPRILTTYNFRLTLK